MLNAKTQYALIILKHLNLYKKQRAIRLKDIADTYKLNLDFLEQVARLLRIAGVIKSVRGPGGGYRLSDQALGSALRVGEIMQAINADKELKLVTKHAYAEALVDGIYKQVVNALNNIWIYFE